MIYVRVDGSQYMGEDSPYDPTRAKLGVEFAVALAAITGKSTGVITAYVQQMNQMQLLYQMRYLDLMRRLKLNGLISFSTTHRMLGSQRDNIVAILGKEHSGIHDFNTTMYFQEPELLNVQLSRHQRLLVVIGNLTSLINTVNRIHQLKHLAEYTSMKITAECILDLAGIERTASGTYQWVRNGDGCVYVPFGAAQLAA